MVKGPGARPSRDVRVVCVAGSPGCGKTSLCEALKEKLDKTLYRFVNLGDLIREKQLYTHWDDEMDCSIFDEELVVKELRRIVKKCDSDGVVGLVIDFHSVGFIPKKIVDTVLVLQVATDVLWVRLEARGYEAKKIQENVQAEIFMESFSEAVDQFGAEVVVQRISNTPHDIHENIEFLIGQIVK